jgi:hypothetical protein
MNIYATKIPMSWVDTKDGKIKFLEFKNAKDPKGTIHYAVRQNRPDEFQLSKNFDAAMIEAIKAKGGIKTNMIIVKDVDTSYKGKLWMKIKDGTEIIVLDAVKKTPLFRKVVTGVDDFSKIKKDKEEVDEGLGDDDQKSDGMSGFRGSKSSSNSISPLMQYEALKKAYLKLDKKYVTNPASFLSELLTSLDKLGYTISHK